VDGSRRPERRPERAPLTFRLVADSAEAYGDPFSPTHSLRVSRDDMRLVVQPEAELFGDVALFLPLRRGLVGITLVAHRPVGEDGYFMLTLSPGRADGAAVPRDVTVVLDVSGSMSGSKLAQAKAALHQLLGSLGERDRFRLLAFSNAVRVHSEGWATPGAGSLRDARTWIDALQADGGTNIAGALAEAFRLPTPEGRLPIVLFLTDGLPSVGEENPERIALQAETERGRARVFAFGVGHDVNTYLLDRLSAAGRGSTQYVQPGEDVEQALSLLAAKIQHPVLADLAIADAPVDLTEVYPRTLPDLFQGEELVVFGRYRIERDARDGQVRVTGRRNGRTERFAAAVSFPARQQGNDFIPRLWASRKLGFLTQQLRLEGHSETLVEEIRETALRYGLLSEYTSYLVQEPTAVAGGVRMPADRLGRTMTMPAAAPVSAASGAGAVQAAEQARARREARTMVELEAANDAILERGHFGQTRHVAGRLFHEIEGVWTDARHADSLRTVAVEPFSEAYFALLRALPELEPYATAFEQVVVTGARASVRIADGGATAFATGELARLVRDFRHR
jgi:Ca-activated chloride channel family protein